MSNADLVLEVLDMIYPEKICDDCLKTELNISRRQQINSICLRLERNGQITRNKDFCISCNKSKKVNWKYLHDNENGLGEHHREPIDRNVSIETKFARVENYRTQIVQICTQIWRENKKDSPPRSISVIINQLKNEEIITEHYANMMLTVCGLRNVQVYENQILGDRERKIAELCMAIITDGWKTKVISR